MKVSNSIAIYGRFKEEVSSQDRSFLLCNAVAGRLSPGAGLALLVPQMNFVGSSIR